MCEVPKKTPWYQLCEAWVSEGGLSHLRHARRSWMSPLDKDFFLSSCGLRRDSQESRYCLVLPLPYPRIQTLRVSGKLRSHVASEHHHGHGVNRRFDEPIMPIEASGFLILGVDQHQPNPDGPGHLDGLEHEVLEERGT